MGNCLPRYRQWRLSRRKPQSTSAASSTTSQLPPPVSTPSHPPKSHPAHATALTDPHFDLLSLHPLPQSTLTTFDGLPFTTFVPPSTLAPTSSHPRGSHRRRRKNPQATLPGKRPSTPNPFDGLKGAPLAVVVGGGGDPFQGLEGAMSVSHVSKNGVSFFPHYSINYEGKEGDGEDGEESVGGTGEGEEEKSRLSSTEMDDDISIRYTTPTMASNHIVRPLPSPSSLSVPQPSIGSGIHSSEHSVIHSTMTQPYRQKSLTSTSGFQFPPVFSPKASSVGGGVGGLVGDMYTDSDNTSTASSPSVHVTAASPPSTTSPLSHPPQQPLSTFRAHEGVTAPTVRTSGSVVGAGVYHPPTTNIQSPPPPTTNHLTLNTNAVALASQLFDDSDLFPSTAAPQSTGPSSADRYSGGGGGGGGGGVQKQRSPRSAMQMQQRPSGQGLRGSFGSSTTNSLSPHSASSVTTDSIAPAGGLHRLSSQPQPSDPHPLPVSSSTSSSLHTPSHSLSLSRMTATPRSPNTGARGSQGRRRGEEEEGEGEGTGEGREGKEDEDSTRGRDSKSREESRVRGVVKT